MEVYHYPKVEKKSLREYILEGLMIFMAVTLGFFAEGLREKIAENSKEKEFILSMIEDAQTDTANINQAISLNKKRIHRLDTMATLCFNYGVRDIKDPSFYRSIRGCITHPDFVTPVERTMFQLKNSGGMRLIQKAGAADSIILYDDITKKLVNQQTYYERQLNVILDGSEELFNFKCFQLDPLSSRWSPVTDEFESDKLISHDQKKLIEFGNKAKLYQGIVIFYVVRLEEVNQHAIDLIHTLKKLYHLK